MVHIQERKQNKPGIQFKQNYVGGLYSDYVTSASFSKPDLVIAMNAGLHLYERASTNDSWHATMQALVALQVPVAVTCYGLEEAIQDAARLESYDFMWVQEPTLNPFRSLMPQREPTPLNSNNFFYHNHYVMIATSLNDAGSSESKSRASESVSGSDKWRKKESRLPFLNLIKQSQR